MDAVLPYAGSSGHSGTQTSKDRADRDDRDGTTSKRQKQAILLMGWAHNGLTWKEFAEAERLHHGQASAVLSNLHKAGKIARLEEKRDRCHVYVMPEQVNGRPLSPYRQNKTVTIDVSATPWSCSECGLFTPEANVLATLGAHLMGRHVGEKVMVLGA